MSQCILFNYVNLKGQLLPRVVPFEFIFMINRRLFVPKHTFPYMEWTMSNAATQQHNLARATNTRHFLRHYNGSILPCSHRSPHNLNNNSISTTVLAFSISFHRHIVSIHRSHSNLIQQHQQPSYQSTAHASYDR